MDNCKGTYLKRCCTLVVTAFVLSVFYAAAEAVPDGYVEVRMPEAFVPATMNDGSPRYITAREIRAELKRQSSDFVELFWNSDIEQFIVPRHDWLVHLTQYYLTFLKSNRLRGKAESWDCENYSSLLNAFATLRIWRAGFYDTRGAIGWLQVDAKQEWAGLPAAKHALMFAITEKGFFIIEPQNGQFIQLEEYPNKKHIQEVFLF